MKEASKKMARMHARRRGSSGSKKPLIKQKPEWITMEPEEIEEIVQKLANEGKDTALIGLILRDQYGIPSVKLITNKSISKILKEREIYPRLPEDLQELMKRAVQLNDHLKKNPRDLHNKRGLHLIEAKIRRLSKYYDREGVLPEGWKYSLESAKLEIE